MRAPVLCAASISKLEAAIVAGYPIAMRKSASFYLVTDGPWAYVGWGTGESAGESIYRFVDGRWCRIVNGGGAMDEAEVKSIAGPAHGHRLWMKMGQR